MPELPEVETVRQSLLDEGLAGRTIAGAAVRHPDAVRHPGVDEFCARLRGATITDVTRRGKYLQVALSTGDSLIAHLRMTGRLWLSDPAAEELTHTHLVFSLDDGRQLRFRDVRRFGGFHLVSPGGEGMPQGLRGLGSEPADMTGRDLIAHCKKHPELPIKALLLDQRVIAGLGNIYVDEALHRAGVHPGTRCASLTSVKTRRIMDAVHEVLNEALSSRGTTFLDFRDGTGEPGAFQAFLRVYRRDGSACRTCGTEIEKTRIAGRGTHFCPNCQRGGPA